MTTTPKLPQLPHYLRAYCKDTQGVIKAYAIAAYQAGRDAALEEAAKAVSDHQREGREWLRGSLWDSLANEGAARIRALKGAAPSP